METEDRGSRCSARLGTSRSSLATSAFPTAATGCARNWPTPSSPSAPNTGSGTRRVPSTEKTTEGDVTVELDRGAAEAQDFWYRLIAEAGTDHYVVGGPVEVSSVGGERFDLAAVYPNPGSGPMAIEFSLPGRAGVSIDLL